MGRILTVFPSGSNTVPCDILVIGSGGGGGSQNMGNTQSAGGGGGAGGVLYFAATGLEKGRSYPVTIGAGGAAATNGNVSTFGSAAALGGGCGASENGIGGMGGSGGGGAAYSNVIQSPGTGQGVTTAQSSDFFDRSSFTGGNNGGVAFANQSIANRGGGGGGARSAGVAATNGSGGEGGQGLYTVILGYGATYASGGRGGLVYNNGYYNNANGTPGAANSGDGGGGYSANNSYSNYGGAGGSGVVIIAYPESFPAPASITGTYDQPSRTGFRVYRFTGSGSITL